MSILFKGAIKETLHTLNSIIRLYFISVNQIAIKTDVDCKLHIRFDRKTVRVFVSRKYLSTETSF